MENRDHFNSRLGFILACIGSAVGMGNIWLFPYRVGQLGGAAFLIPYILFTVLIGYIGIVEEMSFGRAMQSGPVGAFEKVTEKQGSKLGKYIGMIPAFGSLGIAIGYTVVVGWIIRFTVSSFTGSLTKAADSAEFFGKIAGPYGSLIWHILAIGTTMFIMIAGVSKGIEKTNKVVMPVFFFMFVALAIRVSFMPGARDGYAFLLKPDFSKLLSPTTWVYALGQAFFSLSLAGSGTLVYGSYLSKDEDIPYSAKIVAIFDSIAAFLAAIVIIPAVFVYIGAENVSAGPPLMFITMPDVFKAMPGGFIFAIIFFVAVFFAGITSLINLYETPVETLQTNLKMKRSTATAIILGISFVIGIFLENADNLSAWMDIVSIYIIPLGAFLAAMMFFWLNSKEEVLEYISLGRQKQVPGFYYAWGKYGFCGACLVIYMLGIFFGSIG